MYPFGFILHKILNKALSTALLLMFIAQTACKPVSLTDEGSELVVEGWISEGEYPVVLVSRSIPAISEGVSEKDLSAYIGWYANVSLSDGTRTVHLVGKNDNSGYSLPYIFTSSEMLGEKGKTYTLEVSCWGKKAKASSRIVKSVPVTKLELKNDGNDSYSIVGEYENCSADSLSYRLLFRSSNDNKWQVASNYNRTDDVEGTNSFRLFSFHSGETIYLRFCTMPLKMKEFWNICDNNSQYSGNPLFPVTSNLPEIVDGALGFWTAYGVWETVVEIP